MIYPVKDFAVVYKSLTDLKFFCVFQQPVDICNMILSACVAVHSAKRSGSFQDMSLLLNRSIKCTLITTKQAAYSKTDQTIWPTLFKGLYSLTLMKLGKIGNYSFTFNKRKTKLHDMPENICHIPACSSRFRFIS